MEEIGKGNFGKIYKGVNNRSNEPVAIKIEKLQNGISLLKNETRIYNFLNGVIHDHLSIFKIFGNQANKLSLDYQKYLSKSLSKKFNIKGFKIFLRLDKSSTTRSTSFFSAAKSYRADAYLSDTRSPDASCDAIKIFSVRNLCEAINT